MTPFISVVSPVYMAEQIIPELVKRIKEAFIDLTDNYEVILVDDCGPDNSWVAIQEECKKELRVKGIKLSRNYGQHHAITAGVEYAKGDYIVVMDCDLQDNPKYIKELYDSAVAGADIVFTYKESRNHSFLKNLSATIFYRLYNYLLDNKKNNFDKNVGAYSLIKRKVANAFMQIKDLNRDYVLILGSLGFNKVYIPIQHDKRYEGKSAYNIPKLLKHAIDVVTSQTDKLLRLSISIGFIFFISSIIWAIRVVLVYMTDKVPAGYASMMIIELLGTGLILMSLGITGIYIGKIFDQVRQRPLYIIDTTVNI